MQLYWIKQTYCSKLRKSFSVELSVCFSIVIDLAVDSCGLFSSFALQAVIIRITNKKKFVFFINLVKYCFQGDNPLENND